MQHSRVWDTAEVPASATPSIVLRGLTPDTSYAVRVVAQSASGPSHHSTTVAFTTMELPTLACAAAEVEEAGATHVALSWHPVDAVHACTMDPEDVADAADGLLQPEQCSYEVECACLGGDDSCVQPWRVVHRGTKTGCCVPHLRPCCGYAFRVRAFCGGLEGSWGPEVTACTAPAPPPVPAAVACSHRSTDSLTVCWEAGPARPACASASAYQLHMAWARHGFQQVFHGAAMQHHIEGLEPNTQYRFCVCACADAGSSTMSNPVSFATLALAPRQPRNLRCSAQPQAPASMSGKKRSSCAANASKSAAILNVEWQAPAEATARASVASYEVCACPEPDCSVTACAHERRLTGSAKIARLQLRNAECDAAYQVCVRSHGSGHSGSSEWTASVVAVVPPAPPSKPPTPPLPPGALQAAASALASSAASAAGGSSNAGSATASPRSTREELPLSSSMPALRSIKTKRTGGGSAAPSSTATPRRGASEGASSHNSTPREAGTPHSFASAASWRSNGSQGGARQRQPGAAAAAAAAAPKASLPPHVKKRRAGKQQQKRLQQALALCALLLVVTGVVWLKLTTH